MNTDVGDKYRERLGLESATFMRIAPEEAFVAIVYMVVQPDQEPCILKICARREDYEREVYFLTRFADVLPIPRILRLSPPAILMQYLPGAHLATISDALSFEIGSVLARVHLHKALGFGDVTNPQTLQLDPRAYFTLKSAEGFIECSGHLPDLLLQQCRDYYDAHIDLLKTADGPCLIHRDFRPANILVDDGALQGIIDWASMRAGFAEEDFCPLENGEWAISASGKKSFYSGYATIRPVPDFGPMMPLLRLCRALATIGFTVKQDTWRSTGAKAYRFYRQFVDDFF